MSDLPLAVTTFLEAEGLGKVVEVTSLQGGLISLTQRILTDQGQTYIVKQCVAAREDLYEIEADGLRALSREGCPRIPVVYSYGPDHLLLEDFGKREPPPGYWENFGRAVAQLHTFKNGRYGYHRSNYLGLYPMDNTWSDDGYDFFARTRILCFLPSPHCQEVLTPEDRKAVERIASRLPELIPLQGPSLLHGDLWASNMLVSPLGEPAAIDPAVYYGWPEAEISMTGQYAGVDPVFFDAYREVHPLEPGWKDRLELLTIRELLSMIAHQADQYGTVAGLRAVLAKFA